MTFYKSPEDLYERAPFTPPPLVCVCCGEAITAGVVVYDLVLPGDEGYTHTAMHPDCALLMGQRLVFDAFPARRRR